MSQQLREEFNQWALDGRAAELESFYLPFVEDTIERMKVEPRDRILDLGCGEGWVSRLLARLVLHSAVVGLDLSDEMIHNARAKSVHLENLIFLLGEAEEIPWQSEFFSKVLSVESFYYFEDPEKALREIYRVLSPGGSVWILNHISKENEISLRWISDLKVPVQLLSAEEHRKLFERCGFQDVDYSMIPDRTSFPDQRQIRRFPDPVERQEFRKRGALLMSATKP